MLIQILFVPVSLLFGQGKTPEFKAAEKFSEYNLKSHLQFLGNDLFEGRGTGTRGGNLTAKYIAFELSNIGLEPFGDKGTYYQNIPFHGSTPLPSSELRIISDDKDSLLKMYDDYIMIKSVETSFLPTASEMVFAGYGIVAPEFDYNDYLQLDVKDKIVVILDGEPESEDSEYFEGKTRSIYAYPESKIRIASARGASGTIIIPNPSETDYSWDKLRNQYSFEDVSLAYSTNTNLAIFINPQTANLVFAHTLYQNREIESLFSETHVEGFPLTSTLEFRGESNQRDFIAANVVGIHRGIDEELADRYIILSAHYDHLGIGPAIEGDSVYNGVLDNALGVAGLVELARYISEHDIQMRRSVIFLFLTGEEKGLLGSKYYTDNPIVELYKTDADINIDGLAFIDPSNSVVGIGHKYSDIEMYLKEVLNEEGFTLEDVPPEFNELESFLRSDQMSFAKAGIPAVLVAEGMRYQNISYSDGLKILMNYFKNIYHSPFDDLGQKINYAAAVNHLEIIYSLTYKMANTENEINWKPGSPFNNARLRTIAEKK